MLPLVDAFRSAPLLAPAVTEKELSMHKTYGALLDNILAVFQKFGYKEFDIGNYHSSTIVGRLLQNAYIEQLSVQMPERS